MIRKPFANDTNVITTEKLRYVRFGSFIKKCYEHDFDTDRINGIVDGEAEDGRLQRKLKYPKRHEDSK